jgi:FAD dependent oxidoreductase
MQNLITDVLVVGGGVGGTAAAIQSARCGVETILVSEFVWLGGMLTAAGVSAPDGNELKAWQTGLWGEFLQALQRKQVEGLDNGWVSMFTYEPSLGATILAEWVEELPNLQWINDRVPLEVFRQGDRITKVRFEDYSIEAKIVIDATELGDLLALGEIPFRWGWELQSEFSEPSAPVNFNELTEKYPVQSPTWVFMLQDNDSRLQIVPSKGQTQGIAPTEIVSSTGQAQGIAPTPFQNAWENYGGEKFLDYGRLPKDQFMINWPIAGNDYGENLGRLIESEAAKKEFLEEAYWHSYNFARFIQAELGDRYGFADNVFPEHNLRTFHGKSLDSETPLQSKAFALHPYYRESRRLRGLVTITENDILPIANRSVALLPMTKSGEVSAIAVGNYANDHHYPGVEFLLQPKSIRWGGRWTGTPFTIPYDALVSDFVSNLLVCEKNISVSHIANGSTRLQPLVMNIGQAAGMAAGLCVKLGCQVQDLSVGSLQESLLTDRIAPAAVIPLFNLPPEHPDWLKWQRYYLEKPEDYPIDGNCPVQENNYSQIDLRDTFFSGIFQQYGEQEYSIVLSEPKELIDRQWQLITLNPQVNRQLQNLKTGHSLSFLGKCNASGGWLVVEKI